MIKKCSVFCVMSVTVLLLSACASTDSAQQGIHYPQTEKVESIFQISQAPESCKVFAHLFATMPAKMTTGDFEARMKEEAKAKGADMMLIGQARQCTTESDLYSDKGFHPRARPA